MKYIKILLAFLLCTTVSLSYSDSIKSMRAFANSDKTRVVLDLDFNPKYSQALSQDGSQFILRVNNVSNYQSAPYQVNLESKSAIKGISKNIQNKDVRYIFKLQGSGTPKVFVLNPQLGHNYRLVVDFPHSASNYKSSKSSNEIKVLDKKTAQKLEGKGHGVGTPPLHVITVKDADFAEKELLNSLSTVGQDGIRTMTPSQVVEYEKKIAAMKQENAKKNQQLTQNRPTQRPVTNQNHVVEEQVLDTQAPPPPTPINAIPDPFIIAIDAGHGGKDSGALGKRGVFEKNVTLAIATALANYINSNKLFRGKLIRSKDVFVDLDKRSEIARQYKADILISIHADSAPSSSKARGASVWVLSDNRSQRENGKILKQKKTSHLLGGAGEVISQASQNPYLSATILDMTSNNSKAEGYTLAEEILLKLGQFTKLHNKKPIPASLAVLKSPDIPSLLIETGFLSNPYEEIKLNQPNYQKQIAYSIYQGIKSYYEKNPAKKFISRVESSYRTSNRILVHTVLKGESLSIISKKYGVSIKAIMSANRMSNTNLRVGQKITIPR